MANIKKDMYVWVLYIGYGSYHKERSDMGYRKMQDIEIVDGVSCQPSADKGMWRHRLDLILIRR